MPIYVFETLTTPKQRVELMVPMVDCRRIPFPVETPYGPRQMMERFRKGKWRLALVGPRGTRTMWKMVSPFRYSFSRDLQALDSEEAQRVKAEWEKPQKMFKGRSPAQLQKAGLIETADQKPMWGDTRGRKESADADTSKHDELIAADLGEDL